MTQVTLMKIRRERLGNSAAVKGTMLQAHLAWAQKALGDVSRLATHLDEPCRVFVDRRTLSNVWVPFRCVIQIDRAIAALAGGAADGVFRKLGGHSAALNLGGVYKSFVSDEPHRFFQQMAILHKQFQNFGDWSYEKVDDQAGRITLRDYDEFSPVYCASGAGYFEEALRMLKVPGPIVVAETSCQCAGDATCAFEMKW
jgi:predicted hydrocarbon binding protein